MDPTLIHGTYVVELGQLGPSDSQSLSSSKERDLVWATAGTERQIRGFSGG